MPNSILWIGLVVLWVFVLFPMLADRHPRIRRTTDAALATRVLHRGGTKRRMKKGPAAGHDSDPDWVPTRVQRKLSHGDDAEDRMTTSADETVTEHDDETARDPAESMAAEAGSEVLGADIEDAEIEGAGAEDAEWDDADERGESDEDGTTPDPAEAAADDGESREYDPADGESGGSLDDAAGAARYDGVAGHDGAAGYDGVAGHDDAAGYDGVAGHDGAAGHERAADVDEGAAERSAPAMTVRIPPAPSAADPAHLPEPVEFDSDAADYVSQRRGRGGYDPESDAAARRIRYRFRQRTALGLALSALMFGAFAFAVAPMLWWGCALSVLVLATYLVYLRRQVRMEEEIRRRRAARLSRGDHRPESGAVSARPTRDERAALDRDAARVLRRRAVVLDVDDENADFDHLEPFDAAAARATRNRAAGGEIRRAAGE